MNVLQIERAGSTAVLILNRPDQRNALDSALRDALGEAVAQVHDDPDVRAVVITGAGGHFCGGGDVKPWFLAGRPTTSCWEAAGGLGACSVGSTSWWIWKSP